ncbi:CBF1-interacting co-repressor CIR, N-terminal domain [Penicillium digitatum]|uniref:CBF1-interacting co-repressor CIR, N-terminal domain n=1 Tax=Penicillium digitatum TaxID=36651 RepID=A0A7T6XTH9_PENDI|nr:CBF1-interacting co-repressor CIR, N-terminal domain [Penicillium digitatum]
MPLHLLGKKSWNVYNVENIARVKRDEAQAKAREEEDERIMQEVDAARRIKILRGEHPPTPPPVPSLVLSEPGARSDRKNASDAGGFRKRRRVAGENDTDRDIRYAREDAAQAAAKRDELMLISHKADTAQAPILDKAGHINLFPAASAKAEKNPEAEAEASRKKRSYEDQYTMRFSNAAGFKETIGQKPWYSSAEQNATAPESMPGKDVWGNADPRRKERTQARMSANDPLAAIKRGRRCGSRVIGEGDPRQWTASTGSNWMRRTEIGRKTEEVLTNTIVAIEIEV